MSILLKFFLLGVSLMFTAWACCANTTGVNESARCDHKKPKTFQVKIIAGKKKDKESDKDKGTLKVRPETIVACYQDDIDFAWDDPEMKGDFEILFQRNNPFEDNLKSREGRANGKVKINPTREKGPIFSKYDVKAPGFELLDPRIIITPH